MVRRIDGAGALVGSWVPGGLFYQNESSVTNGGTWAIDPPAAAQAVDIEISLTGQSLLLFPAAGKAMSFFINRLKHDGTATYAQQSFSDFRSLFGDQAGHKGNWNINIKMVKTATDDTWLGQVTGLYTGTGGDNIWSHSGDYWRFNGRFYTSRNAGSVQGIRFGSFSGEAGQVFVRATATM